MSRWTYRASWVTLLAVMMACGEAVTDPANTPPVGANALVFGGTVSNPVSRAGVTGSGAAPPGAVAANLSVLDPVTFVSLAPGAVPAGTTGTIRNLRNGESRSLTLVDGGFDPVAVPAAAGDTLAITISLSGGVLNLTKAIVPISQPPRVVRTSPPKGQTDVAINATMAVIFSEPVDPATVDDGSIQLTGGGASVAGTLHPLAPPSIGVEFVPSSPLSPLTAYELVLTDRIKDLDGEPLEAPGLIAFTTTAAAQPPVELAGAWTLKAITHTWRWYAAGGVLDGNLYIVGGRDDGDFWNGNYESPLGAVEAFDPVTQQVTTRAPMPTPRYGLGVGVVNGMLYAIGGADATGPLATVEMYDPATNTWTPRAPLSLPRMDFGVAVVAGTLYAIGGLAYGGITASVEAYDPATDTWSARASLPHGRFYIGAGALNGLVYVTGGLRSDQVTQHYRTTTTEVYDPGANAWTEVTPTPGWRESPGLAVVDGLLYVAGGYDSAVNAYDPATGTWRFVLPLPDQIGNSTVAGAINGVLLVVREGLQVGDDTYIYGYSP